MAEAAKPQDVLSLTAEIVAAHVSNNTVPLSDLPALIQQVFHTLSAIGTGEEQAPRPEPAVPVKKSVMPDYIVCLEDGKRLKMLKRHLRTTYGLSPDAYRRKWNLPADYPMVAPNYAAQRSKFAKQIGLGHRDEGGSTAGRAKK